LLNYYQNKNVVIIEINFALLKNKKRDLAGSRCRKSVTPWHVQWTCDCDSDCDWQWHVTVTTVTCTVVAALHSAHCTLLSLHSRTLRNIEKLLHFWKLAIFWFSKGCSKSNHHWNPGNGKEVQLSKCSSITVSSHYHHYRVVPTSHTQSGIGNPWAIFDEFRGQNFKFFVQIFRSAQNTTEFRL
jgi:hypothetical protein